MPPTMRSKRTISLATCVGCLYQATMVVTVAERARGTKFGVDSGMRALQTKHTWVPTGRILVQCGHRRPLNAPQDTHRSAVASMFRPQQAHLVTESPSVWSA